MQYTPTRACPNPNCLDVHSVHRALAAFIAVRIFCAGSLAFGLYALLGTYIGAVSDPAQRAMERRTCGHMLVRRKWSITAALADMVLLGLQGSLLSQLLQQPRLPLIGLPGVGIWITLGTYIALNMSIDLIHRKATRHKETETKTIEEES